MKKLLIFSALAMLIFAGCSKKQSIYDISVKDIDGKEVSMSQYKGKVLLIVNVASKCGLTPQYEGLEALYQKYKDQGLEILAFPCNQFLGQEPGTNDEIQSFCSLTYNVTFPIFDKIDVNGENESPLYTYLKAQAPFAGYPEGGEEFGDILTQIHQQTGTGFADGRIGKAWIHTTPGQPDQWDIKEEEFMERMTESTKATSGGSGVSGSVKDLKKAYPQYTWDKSRLMN